MILFKMLVSADQTYSFANQANCVLFDVHNDTPYNMGVSFGRDTGADNADYYTSPHSILTGIKPTSNAPTLGSAKWAGTIYIFTETPLGTGATDLNTAPAFQITMIGYPAGYQPSGSTSLARMTATPNAVNTNVNSSTLNNTGNPPGTSGIIDIQPSDAASPTWIADNSGNLTIKGDNAGTLTTLLQLIAGASPAVKLAAAAVLTEVLGNLQVDGTLKVLENAAIQGSPNSNIALFVEANAAAQEGLVIAGASGQTAALLSLQDHTFAHKFDVDVSGNVTEQGNLAVVGTSSLDNGNITSDGSGDITKVGTLNGAYVDNNGGVSKARLGSSVANAGDVLDCTATSLFMKAPAGNFNFQSPSGTTLWSITKWNRFTGTGSGTFNHGLGVTPDIILCNPSTQNGGSQTIGFGNRTSTTVVVTTGNGQAWEALAIKF